eukprot:TRINITY_DN3225_c0_g1_i4.p1 TRINITY_DN3225_c0_g1~~TRINITY_DN3225_c0_g1_i4.p1  ORF type:complete len:159 (-),score=29.53 TRINITY_DN3225_c0_g1_i4:23-499(-)
MVCTEMTAPKIKDLVKDTQMILYQAIKICKPGVPFALIGDLIEQLANEKGYQVCEYFTGHGIGNYLHMSPIVEHTRNLNKMVMEPGNAFTIEPIIFLHAPQLPLMQWNNNFTVKKLNYRHYFQNLFFYKKGGSAIHTCLLYTSPSPRDRQKSRMPSSA